MAIGFDPICGQPITEADLLSDLDALCILLALLPDTPTFDEVRAVVRQRIAEAEARLGGRGTQ